MLSGGRGDEAGTGAWLGLACVDTHRTRATHLCPHPSLRPQPLKATSGTLYKYIKTVSDASRGCVTDA